MRYWSVPPMWEGMTVAVFATGPSLTKEQCAFDGPSIAVNDAYKLAPKADILYAADTEWWRANPEARAFAGVKATCMESCPYPEVKLLKQSGHSGFDPDPSNVRTGGNSGYQAVHVAIHAKAARILLFGFDMHGTHFFGRHPAPLRNTHQDTYDIWASRFEALKDRGAEIVNCTPGSRITCFPFSL